MNESKYPALSGLYAVYDGFVLRCPFFASDEDNAKSFLASSLPATLPAGDRRLDWEVVQYATHSFVFCFKIRDIVNEEVQPE